MRTRYDLAACVSGRRPETPARARAPSGDWVADAAGCWPELLSMRDAARVLGLSVAGDGRRTSGPATAAKWLRGIALVMPDGTLRVSRADFAAFLRGLRQRPGADMESGVRHG